MNHTEEQRSQGRQMLTAIASQTSTAFERPLWMRQSQANVSEPALQTRLQRLYTRIGATDDEMKRRFLARYQLDEPQLADLLSPQWIEATEARPHWMEQLEYVLSEFAVSPQGATGSSHDDRSSSSDYPIPFEELLLPFVRSARHQLSRQAPSQCSLLADEVHAELERWLLASLSQWAGQALQLEFSLFRRQRSWRSPLPQNGQRRHLYEAFLLQYQGKGLLSFFEEYRLLARLLMLLVEQWVEACGEFLHRLQADLKEIERLFHHGQPVGSIIKLLPNCSDPHHGGRSVFLLQFAAGLKLVYKPRSLEMDRAFFALLSWCNAHGLSPQLKVLHVLSRPTYGWMEYVEQVPCLSPLEVQRYYLRSGMLLGLLYVLGGTDMHQENLVACGEHPVLIDLEMAVSPGASPLLQYKMTSSHLPQPGEFLKQTVLSIGLLPTSTTFKGVSQAVDLSGLGGVEEPASLREAFSWQHINTDAMHLGQGTDPGATAPGQNSVLLQGTTVNPSLYTEEMVTGFQQIYRFLLKRRHALLAPEGPLASFEHCPLRIVLRQTETYIRLLSRLQHPTLLHNASDRRIDLQVLKCPLQTTLADSRLWELAEAEIQALEQLDVPWLGTHVASHDVLTESGMIISDVFPVSAQEQIRSCLDRLDEGDLQRQSHLIRSSFLATSSIHGAQEEEERSNLTEEWEAQEALPPDELLAVARQIGHELCAQAFPSAQGHTGWIGFHFDPSFMSFSLQPVGFDLYDGVCGITLFLAALDHITGEHTSRDLVTSALRPLCQHVRAAVSSASEDRQSQWAIGGASGLGSWLYALTHIGSWLHLPELLDVATQAASLLTEQRIRTDRSFDVIGGSAGAILGLLALYQQVGEGALLERALLCGQHLLEQRVQTASGARSWATLQKLPLTGFSHGASGIAYALLRLAQVTEQQVFKEAAKEALLFEQHFFAPEVGNWPDLREPPTASVNAETPATFMTSWCHGAPGIGLARLGALAVLDTPQMRIDLLVALQTTLTPGLPSLDNLCCGNGGCIELLVAASQRLGQPQWLQMARQQASVLVHRAAQRGGFHVLAQLPRQAFTPGLFEGYAGIGYELLRVAFPDQVPSVLLWE